VQHTTGGSGRGAFPLGALGYGLCLFGGLYHLRGDLCGAVDGSVETRCADMFVNDDLVHPRHVAVSGVLAYRLEACSHTFLVLLGCVGMMPLKQILPHGTRDVRGEVWHLMETRGLYVVSEVK
jgi:hypothetical protein